MITPSLIPFLYDMQHAWGTDLVISNTGDIALTTGPQLTQQRILRRLFTTPGTYYFHPTYGAGIKRFIGLPLDNVTYNQVKSLILSQIFEEPGVAKNPTPAIAIQSIQTGIFIQISYVDLPSNQPIVLTFPVSA